MRRTALAIRAAARSLARPHLRPRRPAWVRMELGRAKSVRAAWSCKAAPKGTGLARSLRCAPLLGRETVRPTEQASSASRPVPHHPAKAHEASPPWADRDGMFTPDRCESARCTMSCCSTRRSSITWTPANTPKPSTAGRMTTARPRGVRDDVRTHDSSGPCPGRPKLNWWC